MSIHLKIGAWGIFALMAGRCALAQSQPVAITTAGLPAATVGVPYTFTFSASGGSLPYQWSVAGALPGLLTLNAATGVLSGTAQTNGTFTFTIQVADSTGTTASSIFSLTINPAPLTITTQSPLFSATTGQFYSQVFLASGGVPPYKWAISQSQVPDGLSFDTNAGALTGTPSTAGNYSLTVQVTDSAAITVSKSFQLTIGQPRLTITAAVLPNGVAGTSYSQKLSATGGTPPYTWSLVGSPAGLQLDASTGTLSGIPPAPGTFTFTVQVKDSAGATATKSITLTVSPSQLLITTSTNLPDGTIGVSYSVKMAAQGGTPPFTWSANGLPNGLSLDPSTGAISGAPLVGGPVTFTIQVTDSAHATALALFHLNVGMPPAPNVLISGLPDTASPAGQPALSLSIASPYPVPISGQLSLTFTPDVGAGDSTIQFLTGGRTADFSIPAGNTDAVFTVSSMAIQTGTVAGTITISVSVSAGGVDITPNPQPTCTTHIAMSAPTITAASLISTPGGFEVLVTGFSTALEVSQAVFHFQASGGSALQNADVTVAVEAAFAAWYQDTASIRYGSQFTFTQPFTVQGDASAVTLNSVTLANQLGSTTAPAN